MCAFSSYWVLFSGARYSAHIEIFPEHADTIMHAHAAVYGCAPWLWFISNALNLTLGKFIVIHFTVIQGALRDCPSLQPRLSWQDCVCHTSAHTHTQTSTQTYCFSIRMAVVLRVKVCADWIGGCSEMVQFVCDLVAPRWAAAKFRSLVNRRNESRCTVFLRRLIFVSLRWGVGFEILKCLFVFDFSFFVFVFILCHQIKNH